MRTACRKVALAAMTSLLAVAPGMQAGAADRAAPATEQQLVAEVAFSPQRGRNVPLDVDLATVDGPATLRAVVDDRPFIVAMAWYSCRNLCGLALNGLADAVSASGAEPGRDFRVVVLSMDAREAPDDAGRAASALMQRYPDAGIARGWRFATASPEVVEAVSDAIGFHFVWDDGKQQFAHPAGIVAVDADGVVSDWLAGLNYKPADIVDMVASARGRAPPARGNPVLLLCYDYDPESGEYTFAIMKTLRVVAVVMLAALIAFMAVSIRRERTTRE